LIDKLVETSEWSGSFPNSIETTAALTGCTSFPCTGQSMTVSAVLWHLNVCYCHCLDCCIGYHYNVHCLLYWVWL
jgi:hypothetical protein